MEQQDFYFDYIKKYRFQAWEMMKEFSKIGIPLSHVNLTIGNDYAEWWFADKEGHVRIQRISVRSDGGLELSTTKAISNGDSYKIIATEENGDDRNVG